MRTALLAFALLLPAGGALAAPCERKPLLAGAVATVNALATDAGIRALQQGGNAVDAAIAAALTLGVVDSHNSGIGGGCFFLMRRADGEVFAIDGRETAPAAATRDMFVRDGKAVSALSLKGALAIGVPGSLAAYDMALRHAGRLTLGAALQRGRLLAERGFPLGPVLAARLNAKADDLATFPATRASFHKPDGTWSAGETFVQTDLARTYRALQRYGVDWFYRGPFAQRVAAWMETNGGLLTARDFAGYEAKRRRSVRSRYRGLEVIGFPPPSSGGVHVAQILGILENFEYSWKSFHTYLHVMAEAMKRAFADRAHWLGDPDFARVPRNLCANGYCDALAESIDPERAAVVEHGTPPRALEEVFGKHTTHIAAADSDGNWVAITATINTSFGSKVVIPGTGVLMNNQMDDFAAQPGVPNAYGLVGAEANAVGPGKRPLSSMSPTIVLRDGRPFLTLGGAGGPTIITQVSQTIVNHVDLGLSFEDSVAAPRVHHQWKPDVLFIDGTWLAGEPARLERRGHVVKRRAGLGVTQAVGRRPDGSFAAVSDPRVDGERRGRARTWDPRAPVSSGAR